ncbi:MAG TPA: type II and III secretion system protein [Bryobacteraceae bacterium]|nr:type II and III secretion system protein [Bryobacteraceae bacterium]
MYLVGFLLAACALAQDTEPSAWDLYEQGRAAEKAGHMAQAYLYYAEAAAKDPHNKTYWERTQAVQTRAALEAKPRPIPNPADLDKEIAEEPEFHFDKPTPEDLAAANQPLPPMELDADKGVRDLDFSGDFKKLFQSVARAYGLECVYDSDYQAGTPSRFRLKGVDYRDALHGLEATTGSFIVPITPKIFLVAKDTTQKRTEIEPTVTMAVHFPDIYSSQEMEQMVRAVQQAMAIEKLGVDTSAYTVVMRDRISKVVYARALFQELMHARAQVLLDLRFIEVSRDTSVTYGINFPNIFSLSTLTNLVSSALPSPTSIPLGMNWAQLAVSISLAGPALVAQLSKSDANLLLASQIRANSGQKATLHIGEKYPILTGGYGGYGTSTNGLAGTSGLSIAPSFSFQDLGLTLTTTPVVHDTDNITLDVEAQYQVLTGQSINGLPVISSRALKNSTELKFGEWSIIAGLLSTNEARTLSGLAGLNRIPFLGPLTNTHQSDDERDQVIILMRPTLLSAPPSESPRAFYTGSENRPLTPL